MSDIEKRLAEDICECGRYGDYLWRGKLCDCGRIVGQKSRPPERSILRIKDSPSTPGN